MDSKKWVLKLLIKIFGGKPHYPTVFILLLAFIPILQMTTGFLQIIAFSCMCLIILWAIIRLIYIIIYNKVERARIEDN